MAEPSVGPAHGLQMAPRSDPTKKLPANPVWSAWVAAALARDANGARRRELHSVAGNSDARPKSSNSTAPALRITPGSKLNALMAVATATARTLNDRIKPAQSATGPSRWRDPALPTTRGSSGITQGDNDVSNPPSNASSKDILRAP